jgi:hypothetical protein
MFPNNVMWENALQSCLTGVLKPSLPGWASHFQGSGSFWYYFINKFSFLFFCSYCCFGWGTLYYLQRFLKCIKYIILESHPPLLSLIPSSNSWNSFSRYHFSSTYMCMHYLLHIHPPTLSLPPLPSLWCQPPTPVLSVSLASTSSSMSMTCDSCSASPHLAKSWEWI